MFKCLSYVLKFLLITAISAVFSIIVYQDTILLKWILLKSGVYSNKRNIRFYYFIVILFYLKNINIYYK